VPQVKRSGSRRFTSFLRRTSRFVRQLQGRSVFAIRDVTGPLKGSVTAAGDVTWTTSYGNSATDSFEGDMTAPASGASIVLALQHR
jgi:hypothetical protein